MAAAESLLSFVNGLPGTLKVEQPVAEAISNAAAINAGSVEGECHPRAGGIVMAA